MIGEITSTAKIDYDTSNMWMDIAGVDYGSWQMFNGSIDDVRIYNRALNDAELQKLYSEGQWIQNTGLSGTVYDSTGHPFPDATITIASQSITTDQSGKYNFNPLSPGTYSVTVTKDGYAGLSNSVVISPGVQSVKNFTLRQASTSDPLVTNISTSQSGFRYYLPGIDFPVTYTANVSWGSHQAGKVLFITPKKTYEVPWSGTQASQQINIGQDFDPCATLKVVAVAADGVMSQPKAADFIVTKPLASDPTNLGNFTNLTTNGFSYKFALSLNRPLIDQGIADGVIAKDIPIFGNKGFGLKFIPDLEFEFNIAEGKGTYSVLWPDLNMAENLKYKWTRRKNEHGLKDLLNTLKHLVETKGLDQRHFPKTNIAGYEFALFPMIQVETAFDQNSCTSGGTAWNDTGFVGMAASGEMEWVYQAPPTPVFPWVPWYVKASLGVESDLLVNVNQLLGGKLAGTGDLNPKVSGSVGAGVNDVGGIEGTFTGGIDSSWQWNNGSGGLDQAYLYEELQARIYAFWWEGKSDTKRWEQCLAGSCQPSATALSLLGAHSAPTFTPIARDYLKAPGAGTFRKIPAYTLKTFALTTEPYTVAVTPIATSTYPLSSAALSSAGDNVNLLWITDNSSRSSVNKSMLVHASFDGAAWSTPVPVADDGTADSHPVALTFSDGGMVAAWEDEKSPLADTATLDDAVAGLEISAAVYNPTTKTWGSFGRRSANDSLDRTPKLAGVARNNVLLTWLGNEANDLLGSSTKPNKLWYSFYDGAAWSAPLVAAVIPNAVKRYSVVYDGTDANVVLAAHGSDDLTTLDNLELYRLTFSGGTWGAPTRLTTDTVIDDNPQLALDTSGAVVLNWVRGNELSSVVNFDFNARTVIRAETSYSSNLADFRQAAATDGKVALIYAQPSEGSSSDLFGVFYDPLFRTWGKPKQLTADPETEQYPGIAFQGTETLIAVYNRKLLLNADGTLPTTTTATDLYLLKHTLGVDLALDGASMTVAPFNPAPGDAATITITARNMGDKPVSAPVVAFYNGDPAAGGSKIGAAVITGVFNAGDSRDVTLAWTIPPTTSPLTVYAVIDPDALLDPVNRVNNSASLTFVKPDLTVATVSWEKPADDIAVVVARIANVGSLPTPATTVTFRNGSATGAVLSTRELPGLGPGAAMDVEYVWDLTAFSAPYYTAVVTVDEANRVAEFDETDNSGGVTFPGKQQDLMKQVIITRTGTGSGVVVSNPSGIDCGTACVLPFVWQTPVALAAIPDQFSLFTGWTGVGACGASGDCAFTITNPATVTATFSFDAAHSVRVDGAPNVFYSSLPNAFDNAAGEVVRAWAVSYAGGLTYSAPVAGKLIGGYNSDYSAQFGFSTISGKLTIEKGSLVVDRVKIL